MTALKEYQRLETFGLWHAAPDEQRRDVIVSLGDATLTISDSRNLAALSHWSLPAVIRLNPGQTPACFGPGPEVPEVLEVEDETMIAAIEKVRSVLARRRRQRPTRLRRLALLVAALATGGLAVAWLPGALVARAVAVVPEVSRAAIGEALLADLRRLTGTPCETPAGRRALDRLHARLLPDRPGRILVLPAGPRQSAHLPGGLVLLNRALVEDPEDPAVLAGHILAEDELAQSVDPLRRLLDSAGMLAALRLLATGRLPASAVADHATALAAAPPVRPADESLLVRFALAGVPATPYAFALDITGETTLGLIEADPVPPAGARLVLPDSDWLALQAICGD